MRRSKTGSSEPILRNHRNQVNGRVDRPCRPTAINVPLALLLLEPRNNAKWQVLVVLLRTHRRDIVLLPKSWPRSSSLSHRAILRSIVCDVFLLRTGFIVLIAAIAAFFRPFGLSISIAAAAGLCVALVVILIEQRLRRASLNSLIGGSIGALIGAALGVLFVSLIGGATAQFFRVAIPLIGGYIGLLAGIAKSDLLKLESLNLFSREQTASSPPKLLDTSVLIDGRIPDVAESGFLDGNLVIPQFVLHELQQVADSADSAKRNRGRRGLDVVQRLQKIPRIHVELSMQDFPAIREVDLKLIEFAKVHNAKIVTNDFNLNKLAQVQGVEVLNINELANAVKPVVLPGESMRVFILKEGKEYNQGVAYLDDGTMVVVDNARRHISKTIDITVTSVLQTTAGKMIFGKFDERLQAAAASTGA